MRGIISQIASACGCDRTYISQVINGKAGLTPDHLIKELQTAAAIAQKLQLPVAQISQVLKDLLEMKVVRTESGRYIHNGSDTYLPRHYPQSMAHHFGWRMKAVERAMVKEDIHYTVTFSVSDEDVERLRLQIWFRYRLRLLRRL